ncbi:MAG: DUF5320 domain-containing protein [Elusimicrobia bacterium]|nr:DUF5320 domain-containing protein [Elusimicrobiota bacterium]
MPGGDRTGPFGEGPFTGRGLGDCVGNTQGAIRGRGFGRGFGMGGRGCGMGLGRGMGRGFGLGANAGNYYNAPEFTPQQELNILKEEINTMQNDIDSA